MSGTNIDAVGLSAQVVSAYVSNNSVPSGELPNLIATVHAALLGLGRPTAEPVPEKLVPAIPIKKSITPDAIVCLEDGKAFKSLKRHLSSKYDMTPEQYRTKWNLPPDYPMVAPNYAEARAQMAKAMGLGRKSAKPAVKGRARSKAA